MAGAVLRIALFFCLSAPALTLADLDRVLSCPDLLPPGVEASPMGPREYRFRQPGLSREIRVTTDARYYEENAETVELWSPGSPVFPASEPGGVAATVDWEAVRRILDRG